MVYIAYNRINVMRIEEFYEYDSLRDVRFDDLNDLVKKLNEAIRLLNDLENRTGSEIS